MTESLNQKQREVIVELLIFGMLEDRHVAVSEFELIDNVLPKLGWASGVTPETFLKQATATVRKARDNKLDKQEFLKQRAAKLNTELAKTTALELCLSVIRADQKITIEEQAFQLQLQRLLGR